MTFKPSIWYPIAVVLTVINLAGVALATGQVHATTHAVLAVAFGLWAARLRHRPGESGLPGGTDLQAKLDALDGEVGQLRHELTETQERLDFAERLLAQKAEARRVGPQG
jgi:hypothetical protein